MISIYIKNCTVKYVEVLLDTSDNNKEFVSIVL